MRTALIGVTVILVVGCSGANLGRVTGQVTLNGQPYALAKGESVQVELSTADNAYPPLALGAFAKKDGTFVADMNDGTGAGLPPGKYKVRLNAEGTNLTGKVHKNLFKANCVIDVVRGTPVQLTVDLTNGTIAP
ncbi:MAG: hypothetical protein U0746_18955 [Gemmataceae bacterium]